MKKNLFLLLFILTIISYSQVNNKIIKLVNNNLIYNLNKIPVGKEKFYGFDNRNEFLLCSSGNPIQVLTLENNTLIKQNIWRVPIKLNNKSKILFTVIIVNNEYKIVDIGGVALSKELELYENNNDLFLLRLYSNHLDFISNSDSKDLNIMMFKPLEGTIPFISKASNSKIKEIYSIDEIKSLIK